MGLITRLFGGGMRKSINQCIARISIALCIYLVKLYSRHCDEKMAAALAGAVTNALFGNPPGNEFGREFLKSNKPLVDGQLRSMNSELRICQIVSIAAHFRMNMSGDMGSITPEMVSWISMLNDLGILIPKEKLPLPSSLEELRKQVDEFENWTMKLK
jgi:hypothetical protein